VGWKVIFSLPIFPLCSANWLPEGSSYHTPFELEPSQAHGLLGPLFTERALSDIPLFGSDRPNINAVVERVISSHTDVDDMMAEMTAEEPDIPAIFLQASSLAEKLSALRLASQETPSSQGGPQDTNGQVSPPLGNVPSSQLQRHEKLLTEIKTMGRLSNRAQAVLDHTMLLRAREGYLFNYGKNQKIVADDSWLRDIWAWVAGKRSPLYSSSDTEKKLKFYPKLGAEEAASDGGMISHPLDVGYLGVYTIWTNDLGKQLTARPQAWVSNCEQGANPTRDSQMAHHLPTELGGSVA